MASPQLARILADLERHRTIFDLDNDRLGEELMDLDVVHIIVQMAAERDPDGTQWPELSDAYAKWKAGVSPSNPISYLYGLMDDPEQLMGERSVSADEATMTYGVTEDARQEAVWFQDPQNGSQPERPFYAQTAAGIAAKDELLDRRFARLA